MNQNKNGFPTLEELTMELQRMDKQKYRMSLFLKMLVSLVSASCLAVLVAVLWLPVLEIYGNSMTPTLENGDIVFSIKRSAMEYQDVIAFYYNNDILVKRVIGRAGEWVDIDEEGNVYINDQLLDEPYVRQKAKGNATIEFPYQVPDGKVFVMGDHRDTSKDSRHKEIGCVDEQDIVGEIVFRVWPLYKIGIIK